MRAEQQAEARGTVITEEYPFTPERPEEFEYPVPSAQNAELHRYYQQRAAAVPGLVVCGRLGAYRYFDMDQAIGHAMAVAKHLLARDSKPADMAREDLAETLPAPRTHVMVECRVD